MPAPRKDPPCETCGGTGTIHHEVYAGSGRWTVHEYRCGTCDGSGSEDVPSDRQERAKLAGCD